MHQCRFSLSEHSPARSSPATGTGVSRHARVCSCAAPEKESGSAIRRTEESDRIASLAPAEIEICAGAVLPGSRGTEHQATGALPQPTDTACSASHLLAEIKKKQGGQEILGGDKTFPDPVFQQPHLITSVRAFVSPFPYNARMK